MKTSLLLIQKEKKELGVIFHGFSMVDCSELNKNFIFFLGITLIVQLQT